MRLFNDDNLAVANIWAEARGESIEGKIAVGEVMRTRTLRRYASNGTLASTIFWPKQFSGFNTENDWRHAIFELDSADADVRECYEAWMKSETSDLTKGAVLYCNLNAVKSIPSWARPDRWIVDVGQHSFFRD